MVQAPLRGPPFLISLFHLSSHGLFACLPHHSREMPFIFPHTQAERSPYHGSCSADGNDVGFLRLQAAVLILARVFTSCVVNGDFSELTVPHLYKTELIYTSGFL